MLVDGREVAQLQRQVDEIAARRRHEVPDHILVPVALDEQPNLSIEIVVAVRVLGIIVLETDVLNF